MDLTACQELAEINIAYQMEYLSCCYSDYFNVDYSFIQKIMVEEHLRGVSSGDQQNQLLHSCNVPASLNFLTVNFSTTLDHR